MLGQDRFGRICRLVPRWQSSALLALVMTANITPAQAAVCTFAGGVDQWDNPSAWLNCVGGAGNNAPDTPGIGDTAIINSGTVTVSLGESVSSLQLEPGGTLFLDGSMFGVLEVDTSFDWSGGVVDGFTGNLNLLPGSISSWTGADKTLRPSNNLNLGGIVTWSAGLIHVENSLLAVQSTGIWNWDINGAVVEIIDSSGGPNGQIFNEGIISKIGAQVAATESIPLAGPGTVNVLEGTLRIGASAFFSGSFGVDLGATLELVDTPMLFDSGTSFNGAGNVQFGRPGAPPGCDVTLDGVFTVSGTITIQSCEVDFLFPPSLVDLELLDVNGSLNGSTIQVSDSFTWSAGAITGSMELQSGSISVWNGADKTLRGSLSIDGTVTWTAGPIHLEDILFAGITVSSTGTWNWDFNGPLEYIDLIGGTDGFVASDGEINKTGTAPAEIRFPISLQGSGLVEVNEGDLLVAGPANYSGDLDVASGARLIFAEADHFLAPVSSVSGAGNVQFGLPAAPAGCEVTINGGFSVTGTVRIQACDVSFGNAGVTFVDLELLDPFTVLRGAAAMEVTGSLVWDRGGLNGLPGQTFTIQSAVTSVLGGPAGGGVRGVTGRELINNGAMQFTVGNQTNFSGGAIWRNGPSGTMNFNVPAGQTSRFEGPPGPVLINEGEIDFDGGTGLVINIQFDNAASGVVRANAGFVNIAQGGADSGSYEVALGALLHFNPSLQRSLLGSGISGAGDLLLGNFGPPVGCSLALAGALTLDGTVEIRSCTLGLFGPPTTITTLEMLDVNAEILGPAAITVSGSFVWDAGVIFGSPGETFTIDNGVSTTLAGPPGVLARRLFGRELINNGTMTFTVGNRTGVHSGGIFRNSTSGQMNIQIGGGELATFAWDASASRLINEGTFDYITGASLAVEAPFDNTATGVVNVNSFMRIANGGTEAGSYAVASLGTLEYSGSSTVRTAVSGSNFSGPGVLAVRNAAELTVEGSFSVPRLFLGGGGPGVFRWNQGNLLSLGRLELAADSELDTLGNVSVSTIAVLGQGRITGALGTLLTLAAGSNTTLPASPGETLSFDNIGVGVAGLATWTGGDIHFDNAASLFIDGTGDFGIEPAAGIPLNLGCSLCLAPSIINSGLVRKTAMGTGDDVILNPAATFQNEGTVLLQGGDFQTHNYNQLGSAALTELQAGATLTVLGSSAEFQEGTLRGSGQIVGDVDNTGATVQPGLSPGVLTINGNYDQSAGQLDMEIGGNNPGEYDQLIVSGTATLDGLINLLQFAGFVPVPADTFSLIQASSVIGTLTQGVNEFPGFDLQYSPTEVLFAQGGGGPLIVTSTADPGDGVCDIEGTGDGCTLREAINAANANPGPDVIEFAILSAGVQTIAPLSPLPAITEDLFINGYSQPGAVPNTQGPADGGLVGTLLIEISGQNTTGDGLVVAQSALGAFIDGLVVNRWSGAGVRINAGPMATIVLSGNYIGTSADGLSVPGPQGTGVLVTGTGDSDFIAIGEFLPAQRNLISGNLDHGVVISTNGVNVMGNLIGTDVTGLAPLGNGRRGIFLSSNSEAFLNQIGGDMQEMRNVIGGNGEDGIGLQCAPVTPAACFDGSRIWGNYIGVGVDGSTPLPNANGVNVIEMTYGRIEVGGLSASTGNKIYFNLGTGVLSGVFAVDGDETEEGQMSILGNGFLGNGFMAIDLGGDGPTPNDPDDADGGFNNGQNFPEISAFLPDTPSAGQTTVEYRVDSLPANSSYPLRIEFYRAAGNGGQEFLGADSYLLAEAGLTVSYVLPGTPVFLPEDIIIATASGDNAGKELVKTSEFSFYPVTVEITDDSPDPSVLGDPYTVEVSFAAEGPFQPRGEVLVDDGVAESCMFSLLASDNGVGSCVLSSPATTGIYTLGAAFDGVPTAFGFAIDLDGEPHTVNNPTVTTIVSDLPDPSGVGDPYTVQVDVTAGVGVPLGTIGISSTQGESCNFALVAGSGSCVLAGLNTGLRTLTATYTPDPGFDTSEDIEDHTVVLANSVASILSALPDPSAPGSPVTVMVEVAPAVAGNVLTPTGAVSVSATTGESCNIGALDGSGMGSCDLVFNTVGLRDISATYAGDASFNGAVSALEPHEVTNLPPEATTTTIVSSVPSPSVVGQNYLVNVQVVGALGNTPCGEVLLTQLPDGLSCNAVLGAGPTAGTAVGSCSQAAPSAITKAITGSYQPGACNFDPSAAPLFTHPVNRASTITTITGQSPNPSNVGQPVTVSFAVAVAAPGAGTPTGSVTVSDGIDVCQATLPATSCQLSFKTEGTRNLSVSYGGDPDFNASATAGTQQVGGTGSGADLTLRKFNDLCTLPGGTRVAYQIEVSNLGPEAVSGARVTDTLPAGLSNASWTCSAGTGASCAASGNGSIDQLVSLASGASLRFVLSADVQLAPELLVSNTASITAPSGVIDPVLGNNSSTDSDHIGVYCDSMEAPLSD